jgi:hypothetical protein
MEQYPVLKRSGNARLARKFKGIRHLPSQAVGMRPALSKGVVELTNAPKTETLRKRMKAQRNLEHDFCGKRCARAATALALREKAPARSYPQRTHYPPAKTL